MINKETLKNVKKGAIFLNYARGEVVVLEDLKEALEKGQLSGAAIDVFPVEPERTAPLSPRRCKSCPT